MEKNYISKVIGSFFNKKYSDATNKKVQQWLIEEDNKEEKTNALYEVWENTESEINQEAFQALNKVRVDLGMETYKKKATMFHPYKLMVAAALFILFLLGGISYFYSVEDEQKYVTMYGEIKTIDLPDGSKVWLNSGSSISYVNARKENRRIVKLSGEGYFIVAADSTKPFIVETNTLSLEVLGTEFNLEAYTSDTRTTLTLESGKVKAGIPDRFSETEFYILQPGQQLIYDPLSGSEIIDVYPNEIKSWRDGKLIFHNVLFKDIINKLERHFNVKIIIHNFENSTDHYSVKFINGENIWQIMKVLEGIGGNFTYEIQ